MTPSSQQMEPPAIPGRFTERFLTSQDAPPHRHGSEKAQEQWNVLREAAEGRTQQLADEIADGGDVTELQRARLSSLAEVSLSAAVLFESLTGWMSIVHDSDTDEHNLFQAVQHAAATAESLKGVLSIQLTVLKELRKHRPRKPG